MKISWMRNALKMGKKTRETKKDYNEFVGPLFNVPAGIASTRNAHNITV